MNPPKQQLDHGTKNTGETTMKMCCQRGESLRNPPTLTIGHGGLVGLVQMNTTFFSEGFMASGCLAVCF